MDASCLVQKKPIIFPKVPVYVKGPVAPLFREWGSIVDSYESHPGSLHNAWLYLGHHPAFWKVLNSAGGFHVATGQGWYQCIETGVNEDDTIWVEIRPSRWPDDPEDNETHLIEVEAPSFESAITTAAVLVHGKYRNDREFLKADINERWLG